MLLIADGLVLPLAGCWLFSRLGHVCEAARLWDCRQWPLALVCLWASGFGGAGLWGPPSESGVAFLLVGVPALGPVHLSVPVRWRWRRRRAAQRGGSGDQRIWRRRRRHWRRSLGRRPLRSQRGCVAARGGSFLSGSAAAEAAALAGLSLPLGLVRVVRFTTGRKDRSLLITASA